MLQQLIIDHIDLWTSAETSRSTAGRGSNGKTELTGIKKLRELILELAVRGLLVPQDPNDEPASVLLEKIAAEKEALIKAGKLKKQKPLPEITDDEKPFDLPDGWARSRLDNIGITNIGLTYSPKDISSVGTPVLRSSNIQNSKIDLTDLVRVDKVIKENVFVSIGDLIICARNGSKALVGKTAMINELPEPMTFGAFMAVFRSKLNPYIEVFLNSPSFRHSLEGVSTTTINQITQNNLRGTLLAIPPLAEQHRIVAKVDELMALCDQLEQQQLQQSDTHHTLVTTLLDRLSQATDNAQFQAIWSQIAAHFDSLFTTEASIDQLKQTLLQLAVMGKLVPQDPNDEPASVLLEKIAAEKAQLIKDGKIKKQKPLPEIIDDDKALHLPKGWEYCRLDSLSISSEAGWSPKCESVQREGNGWGILKVSAVTWGVFNPDENKALPSNLEAKPEYEVKPGDFLISRANTAELIAKAVIVPAEVPRKLMMSDKIIRFAFSKFVCGNYINVFNKSVFARNYYSRVAGGTSSSMKNVSREQIRNLLIPLPPVNEQHRIVAKVDELMALCDQLKAGLNQAQTTQQQLAHALVEQAINDSAKNTSPL